MALMTLQTMDATSGIVPTLSAVNSSDTFANDGKTMLIVNNGSGSTITVTITSVLTSADDNDLGTVTLSDITFSVAAGARRLFPFFKPARFNNSSGLVTVGYSSTTTVTSGAVQLQRPL